MAARERLVTWPGESAGRGRLVPWPTEADEDCCRDMGSDLGGWPLKGLSPSQCLCGVGKSVLGGSEVRLGDVVLHLVVLQACLFFGKVREALSERGETHGAFGPCTFESSGVGFGGRFESSVVGLRICVSGGGENGLSGGDVFFAPRNSGVGGAYRAGGDGKSAFALFHIAFDRRVYVLVFQKFVFGELVIGFEIARND